MRWLLLFLVASVPAHVRAGDIETLRSSWVHYLHDKQLEKAIALYADDAIFFEPDGKRAVGKAEIRALFSSVMKTFDSDIHLKNLASDRSGDMAYESGDFDEVLVAAATGQRINARGSYLMILKRQSNDRWKIVQHMWTRSVDR